MVDFLEPRSESVKKPVCPDDFCPPPNMWTVWFRLPEFVTDPSSNQLSASRFVLFLMGLLAVFVSVYLTLTGRGNETTTLIAAVAATAAGVYFGSQFKDLRFKRDRDKE